LVLIDLLKHYLAHPVLRDESDHFIATGALQVLIKYDVQFCEGVIFYARLAGNSDALLGVVPIIANHYQGIPLLENAPAAPDSLSKTFALNKQGWESMEMVANFDDGRREKAGGFAMPTGPEKIGHEAVVLTLQRFVSGPSIGSPLKEPAQANAWRSQVEDIAKADLTSDRYPQGRTDDL
jgi:hypothetical protein